MKIKIKNKFEEMRTREGTIQKEESITDKSQQQDTDIYSCLKKYGITTLVNQTMAKEYLYLDNTNRNMTLDEAIRQREQLNEYFKNQPARVRKVFGDNVDIFIEKYKNQEFKDFLTTGVLSKEQIETLTVEPPAINKEDIQEKTEKGETNE